MAQSLAQLPSDSGFSAVTLLSSGQGQRPEGSSSPRPSQHWHRREGCWRAHSTAIVWFLPNITGDLNYYVMEVENYGAGPVWSVKDSGIFIIVDADIHINKCVWQDCRCPMKTVHWSVLSNRGPGFMWSSIPQHRQPIRRPHVWFSQKLIRKL